MQRDRRWWIIGVSLTTAVLCLWCAIAAAISGWVAGRDIGRREARIELRTASALDPELPELGILVTRLDRAGPAMLGGIERGDLIVALETVHVQDARDLREQLLRYRPGDRVTVTVLRDQAEQSLSITLDPFPGNPRVPYLGVYYTARGEEPADL